MLAIQTCHPINFQMKLLEAMFELGQHQNQGDLFRSLAPIFVLMVYSLPQNHHCLFNELEYQ